MEERSNLLEELAVLGFTEEKLREIQQKTERQEYDVLDITLDLVYAVAPIKRAMRAERLAEKLALLTPQQRALAEVILRNYVIVLARVNVSISQRHNALPSCEIAA